MKLNPNRLTFGDFEFRQLVEESLRTCVLAYNPPKFTVIEINHDEDSDLWTIDLDEPEAIPPTAPAPNPEAAK